MLDSEEYEEMEEALSSLAEYYSMETGRNIQLGIDQDHDVWFESSRTNGKEYYESISDIESRVKQLYPEVFMEDFSDPMEGI